MQSSVHAYMTLLHDVYVILASFVISPEQLDCPSAHLLLAVTPVLESCLYQVMKYLEMS